MNFHADATVQIVAALLFACAILHTFSVGFFERLAHKYPAHGGTFHLLGEVEAVFGIWAALLLGFIAVRQSPNAALTYLESRSFVEPAFIFVIMVVAASRPVLDLAGWLLVFISKLVPLPQAMAYYIVLLTLGPLLGSFITEPAAMTLTALLLRNRYFSPDSPSTFKYATLGVLFVNVSIGGTLTAYAAPPVLMVAEPWGWNMQFMMAHFGWKAALAAVINAAAITAIYRSHLRALAPPARSVGTIETPLAVILVHVSTLAVVVIANHHPMVFVGVFLLFLGFTEAYKQYQTPLILREGLMVGFFLAGLIVLGGLQRWWLQPLLASMDPTSLYYGATLLTAVTDNAALTYLGTLVQGLSAEAKYALVAGAVTGGGLTVIANAPNPAGFAILKSKFENAAISPLWLAVAATPPTLVAIAAFQLLPY